LLRCKAQFSIRDVLNWLLGREFITRHVLMSEKRHARPTPDKPKDLYFLAPGASGFR